MSMDKIKDMFKEKFMELVPFNVAVIDRKFKIVSANDNFSCTFGAWSDKKCFEVCKKSNRKCSFCRIEEVFKTGKTLVANETVIDSNSAPIETIVYFSPVEDDDGTINHVIEMSFRVSDSMQWQRDYNILFERVPNYISIIDRNYKIVRANKKFRDTFGEARGQHCFKVYKNRRTPCKKCPAALTFSDGYDHSSAEVGVSIGGNDVHYMVSTTPVAKDNKGIQLVMEICNDITELNELENQIRQAHDFYAKLIKNSEDGIIGITNNGKVQIFNDSARKILDWPFNRKPGLARIQEMFPSEIFLPAQNDDVVLLPVETKIFDFNGRDIPVRLSVIEINNKKLMLGRAIFIRDLREIKSLEREKIEAEKFSSMENCLSLLSVSLHSIFEDYKNKILSDNSAKTDNLETILKDAKKELEAVIKKSSGSYPDLRLVSPLDLADEYVSKGKFNKIAIRLLKPATKPKPILFDPGKIIECFGLVISLIRDNLKSADSQLNINFSVYDGEKGNLNIEIALDHESMANIPFDGIQVIRMRNIIREHGANLGLRIEKSELVIAMKFNRPRLELIAEHHRDSKD